MMPNLNNCCQVLSIERRVLLKRVERNHLARLGTVPVRPRSRRAFRLLVIAALLAMLFAGASTAHLAARQATPAASPTDLPRPLLDFAAAWSSGDPEQVVALFAADGVFEEAVLDGVVTNNHAELRAFAAAAFAAFPDFTATPVDGFVAGDRAVLEWILSATYLGSFGTLPPGTGQRVDVRVASVLTYENGLITHDTEYWDVATLLAQVGVLPAS